ncbi:MAG: hypothetical protein JWO67_145 [Streptosporangiaceae bacterium]|nr:hypothetical protein [Streptosporangiaceae bacterium]
MTDLPDQPDGIEDDSRDLPNPVRAAERVDEYICASGDGLYDIQGGAPLYARDLEAITRAVRDRATALEPSLPLPVADGSGLVTVDPADLRLVLDQKNGHSHRRPGIWDADNPPWRANRPCVECAAGERLRAALATALEPSLPLPVADGSEVDARITPAVSRTFAAPVTFYEPDEPVANVQAAFEAGEKGVTRRPAAEGQERSEEQQ